MNKINEERLQSFNNVEGYVKELKKLDKNFNSELHKVNAVGGIGEEHTLYYKGIKICRLPPRQASIFGYDIFNDKGERVKLETEKPNRIKTEKEKEVLTTYLLEIREKVNDNLKQEREKQANREQKAKD